ncbi:MAG: hypothetical protein KKB37_01860, partial [Alphaproteobacteria bacterium]|nr:hypothetical protein [Alphaproteobacteria bacterium]
SPHGPATAQLVGKPGGQRAHAQHSFDVRPTDAVHHRAVASADVDEDYYDDETPSRGGWLMVAAALFVAVLIGAGGLFAYNNQDQIRALVADFTDQKASRREIEVVRAPAKAVREPAQTAADAKPDADQQPAITTLNQTIMTSPERTSNPFTEASTQPAPAPPAEKPMPELPILKSKLWQFAQQEFGQWTEERLAEVRKLAQGDKSREEANKHLVDSFVRFRRDNAAVALMAAPASLEGVAEAFVESLRALTARGPEACYAFISNGESTPEVANLYFEPSVGPKLEAQMLAIMKAVADGKASPTSQRQPPTQDDFGKLSTELANRGWTAADLKLFSDPDALSKAEPALVCRLVTEWFATQTTLADQTTRDQLIAASLRPVIGG